MFKPLIGFKMLPMKVLFIESKECKKNGLIQKYATVTHTLVCLTGGVIVVCVCLLENQSNFLLF